MASFWAVQNIGQSSKHYKPGRTHNAVVESHSSVVMIGKDEDRRIRIIQRFSEFTGLHSSMPLLCHGLFDCPHSSHIFNGNLAFIIASICVTSCTSWL
jgi:hypothetical protein